MSGGDVHVLIVDEDPQQQQALARMFAGHGYRCTLAATPSEAEGQVRATRPDAIVLDWVFHDGSGVGLARRLRAAAAVDRALPIIALSVWDEPYKFGEHEGIDVYFVKPAPMADLDRAIRDRLRGR